MNLASNPTRMELKGILAALDDSVSAHLPWVGRDGEFHFDPLREPKTPSNFIEERSPIVQFWFEMVLPGNSYVGRDAANDPKWVDQLFNALVRYRTIGAAGFQEII